MRILRAIVSLVVVATPPFVLDACEDDGSLSETADCDCASGEQTCFSACHVTADASVYADFTLKAPPPETIVSGTWVDDIYLTSSHLYWTDIDSRTFRSLKDGGAAEMLGPGIPGYPIAADDTGIYALDNGALEFLPEDGGASSTLLTAIGLFGATNPIHLLVDQDNAYALADAFGIVPLDGGTAIRGDDTTIGASGQSWFIGQNANDAIVFENPYPVGENPIATFSKSDGHTTIVGAITADDYQHQTTRLQTADDHCIYAIDQSAGVGVIRCISLNDAGSSETWDVWCQPPVVQDDLSLFCATAVSGALMAVPKNHGTPKDVTNERFSSLEALAVDDAYVYVASWAGQTHFIARYPKP